MTRVHDRAGGTAAPAGPAPGRRRVLLLLSAAALAACGRSRGEAGAKARVVSISPSTTEAVFAVGAGGDVVGRSQHCDYPPEAKALPVVGGYADPSVEAIVALAPTLVVGARGPAGPSLEQALAARGIETYFPETESIAQIEAMIEGLGRRLHREDGAAATLSAMRLKVASVALEARGRPRARAVILFDVAPIVAAGPGSFPDELLRLAGGENAVTRGGAYPTLGLEQLLAMDPDAVIDAAGVGDAAGGGVLAQRGAPGWRDLRAVREGRVRAVDSAAALRPGPRIGEGLASLARALRGEAETK